MIMSSEKFGDIFSRIKNFGIIPVLKIEEAEKAVFLAEAVYAGGLSIAEISLETDCVFESIKNIAKAMPEMLLAAGNVLTVEQAVSAAHAGADLIISIGFDGKIAAYCAENNIMLIPCCSNDDDIDKALSVDIDVVKILFPGINGGIGKLNVLSKKYPQVKFILSGDKINENNLVDCLSQKPVIACGASFIFSEEDIRLGDFEKIKNLTAKTVHIMLGYDLAHVVMNCENSEQADSYSSKIASIFGFERTDSVNFISTAGFLHFMKNKSYGKNGQIAVSTNFMDRAVFYIIESGKYFINESARYDDNGELTSIYLDSIIGGFAIKLVLKEQDLNKI